MKKGEEDEEKTTRGRKEKYFNPSVGKLSIKKRFNSLSSLKRMEKEEEEKEKEEVRSTQVQASSISRRKKKKKKPSGFSRFHLES